MSLRFLYIYICRLRETYRAESRDLKRLLDHVKKSNMTELNDVQQVIEKQGIAVKYNVFHACGI